MEKSIFENRTMVFYRIDESTEEMIIGLAEERLYANNHEFLKQKRFSIYLKVSIETLFQRLSK
jgi:shikimate kinase